MKILHTVLWTFPEVLIQSMEKLDAGHSKGLRDKVTSFFTGHDVEMLESIRDHTRKKGD